MVVGTYIPGTVGYIVLSGGTGSTTTSWITTSATSTYSQIQMVEVPNVKDIEAPVLLLKNHTYKMPNGSRVIIDDDGGFRIDDKDAKVIYRASRVYDFNPFLNASDLLEEYIRELVPHGVRQDEVLKIPIESFIYWLVHKAAEKDNEPVPKEIPRLPRIDNGSSHRRVLPSRCSCGRFVSFESARNRIYFCSPEHFTKQMRKLECLKT